MKYRVSAFVEINADTEPDNRTAFRLLISALHGLSKDQATVMVEGPIFETSTQKRSLYQRQSVPTEKAVRTW